MVFDRRRFADLLAKAKGKRSINQYSMQCGVDAGYISRLLRGLRDSPPSAEIIRKLAAKAHGGVTVQQLLQAAGYLDDADNHAAGQVDDCSRREPASLEEFLQQQEVMFDGVPMTEEEKESVLQALKLLWRRRHRKDTRQEE